MSLENRKLVIRDQQKKALVDILTNMDLYENSPVVIEYQEDTETGKTSRLQISLTSDELNASLTLIL